MSSWKDYIRKVVPYTPGEQPKTDGIIKLNTNENPYPPSPLVGLKMKEMSDSGLRKYPDATSEKLIRRLADYHNVGYDQVFAGVGSDDVLGMIFMTFFNSDKKVLFPDISYSFYPVWAELLNIPYEQIPLDSDYRINEKDYNIPNGGIVIANPNAPTGILLEKDKIINIIENNQDSIVVIDEAYIDFAPEGSSCLDLIDKYENVIVVRTFSKSRSLAGLRVGYAISRPENIKYINDVKYSYNSYTLNTCSIEVGSVSIDDEAYFRNTVNKIVSTREAYTERLKELGFNVLPSSTNFVFASHKSVKAIEIFNYLKSKNIFVRYFNVPKIDNFLRITIGTDEEMEKLCNALTEIL